MDEFNKDDLEELYKDCTVKELTMEIAHYKKELRYYGEGVATYVKNIKVLTRELRFIKKLRREKVKEEQGE